MQKKGKGPFPTKDILPIERTLDVRGETPRRGNLLVITAIDTKGHLDPWRQVRFTLNISRNLWVHSL